MKLKKPTQSSVVDGLTTTASGVVGMLASNGIADAIPMDNKTTVKAIVAAVGFAGAIAVSGNDTTAKIVQGVCSGMALQQVKELVKDVAAGSLPANDGTAVNKFVNAAFEQATPVTSSASARAAMNALAARRRARSKKLGNPDVAMRLAQPQMAMV